MQQVYVVIKDQGDGSQCLEWHRTWSDKKQWDLETLEEYQSGDGVQVKRLRFPDGFDLAQFSVMNHIDWYEDSED